ncbi:MAG: HypC/HybG/HupF family hydrogenase formation chaperone [Alphaproteobacteria bacterium]|nr:HypC/HybG/HupF family hydrogenase formation chaperone [Alphaproteobacteria bacterium]
MCLAIPAKVIALMPGDRATVSLDGVTSEVSVVFLDDVGAGDYVIIHAGHALSRIDPDEAEKTLEMLRMMSLQGANAGV